MYISVLKKIGDRATDMQQGDLIHEDIVSGFANHESVEIDFNGMKTILSTFLNNAIGALYKDYSSEFLNSNLKIVNLCDDDMFILKKVIARAKDFYANPQDVTDALNDSLWFNWGENRDGYYWCQYTYTSRWGCILFGL